MSKLMQTNGDDPSHNDIFPTMIRRCSTSDATSFSIIRDNNKETVSIILPRAPKPETEMPTYEHEFLGFKVRTLSIMDKIDNDLSLKSKGIVVDNVENGGWANLADLNSGDVSRQLKALQTVAVAKGKVSDVDANAIRESAPETLTKAKMFLPTIDAVILVGDSDGALFEPILENIMNFVVYGQDLAGLERPDHPFPLDDAAMVEYMWSAEYQAFAEVARQKSTPSWWTGGWPDCFVPSFCPMN